MIVWDGSLGHRVKTLGDWVKTSAGSKWNMGSISISSISIRVSIAQVGSIGLRLGISRSLAIVVTNMAKTIVRDDSLGHWVKTLGDWVKTGAGSKWNMGSVCVSSISIRVSIAQVGSIGLWLGISRSLAIVVTNMTKSIVRNDSLGHRVKSLGDWVKTGAGSKWNMGSVCVSSIGIRISITKISSISLRFGISRSLAIVVTNMTKTIIRNSSLGHRVKTLGDWVKTGAGSKRHMSIPINSMGIRISIAQVSSICVSLS